ncbi:unnamed protein product [Parnassius mnemosyne]|uniref:Uncharacterized protein n=1 Tax=Parnassius mnemosyne TaxID=213953 RepID=A0AAV1K7U3_9NEOP
MDQHIIISTITALLLLYNNVVVSAQSAVPRCFHFTWLGPRYNNESVFLNATCQEATRLADGVPCVQPLVASYDGTWPDVEYIWTHHSREASCILGQSDVCAKYTYYFDGHVENSTYMCTRAVDSFGEAVTSGCYQQRNGSFATRVCFCRSVPGGVPCNEAVVKSVVSLTIFIIAIALVVYENILT